MPARECSSIVLNNNGLPVFGANLDHVSASEGLIFVNTRGAEKTSLYAGTTGVRARWRSRYASDTFNLVGYQLAWAGMNEQGLTLSTMSLYDTEYPAPDERPPLDSGEWMQYVLDTCATVEDVIASDELVRIITVDHYLVADGLGNRAAVEFLDGEMVVTTGDDMAVPVLTNTVYSQAEGLWSWMRRTGDYSSLGGSLARFCLAADRVEGFVSTDDESAVAYAFDTLELIRGEDFSEHTSQWSIVFDTRNLRAWFRTHDHPVIRYLDLEDLELSCATPVQMLDIQEELSGDVAGALFEFDYDLNFEHMRWFMRVWGIDVSTAWLHQMCRHFESFSCWARQPRPPTGRHGSRP